MPRLKIALIGNSGVGKTAAMMRLCGDPDAADMDKHFDPRVCPHYGAALDWILARPPREDVATVSTHYEMLVRMRDAKRGGAERDRDRFGQILFVYLGTLDTTKLFARLNKPDAWGRSRGWGHTTAVMSNAAAVHAACLELADVAIVTDALAVDAVAGRIAAIRDQMRGVR